MQPPLLFSRLALLGAGYIGGSVALAARRAGVVQEVVGFDPSERALESALRMQVIDAAVASPEEAVRGADVVLLACPVQSLVGLLESLAPVVPLRAAILDVGSVKAAVVERAEAVLPQGQFVGCHPMAGAEFSGVEAADSAIFAGRVCFVCPARNATLETVGAAHGFWQGIGCQTMRIDPEVHDRLMAAQSHLPHVAAFALAATLASEMPFLDSVTTPASPTTSLRDTTRIAASGPSVWRDILLANSRYVLPLIADLQSCVEEMKTAVASGDGEKLERLLARGQACRQHLVKA